MCTANMTAATGLAPLGAAQAPVPAADCAAFEMLRSLKDMLIYYNGYYLALGERLEGEEGREVANGISADFANIISTLDNVV